jgi:hypothetical protein
MFTSEGLRLTTMTTAWGPGHADWQFRRVFLLVPAQVYVARWISSFKEFPPRQKPASFSVDEVMKKRGVPVRGVIVRGVALPNTVEGS